MTEPTTDETRAQQLLRTTTTDLTSDVDSLVRGGVSRGRTQRRRRRVGTALAAAAVVGVIGVAASVAPGSETTVAPDAAGTTASETPPSPTTEPTPVLARTLAVRAADVPAAFASIFPGEITALPQKEVDDERPIVDFRWNGYAVRVGVVPSEPAYGATAAEQCATSGPGNGECREVADGTWVQALESTGPAVDGGISSVFVTAYTPDGWTVHVASHNAASSKAGPVLADAPPFSVAQLEEAATSDVWFDAELEASGEDTEPAEPAAPQRIAVKARDIPALVTAVVPGDVVPYEPYGGYVDAGSDVVAHFQLDGMLVSAGISRAQGDPLARCRESYPARGACTQRPDGSVLGRGGDQGPAVDGGVSSRAVSLLLPGFDVFVMAYNSAAGKDSPVLAAEPPLTYADLEAVVTGPGWVTEGS